VSPDNVYGSASAQSYAPQWAPESPFLRTPGVAPPGAESAEEEEPRTVAVSTFYEVDSPFRSEMRDGAGTYAPEAEEFVQLLTDLNNEMFNEALYELMTEASTVSSDRFAGRYEDPAAQAAQEAQIEGFVQEHFAPLNREAEALLDNMAQGMRGYDPLAMTETELETLLDGYEPVGTQLSPSFEFFLKGLWNKAKGVVKGAVNLVKKGVGTVANLALGPLLNKLKGLVRPLLQRVLKFAMDKLPPQLRPVAQQLAKRFLGEAEGESSEAFEEEQFGAHADPDRVQREFDATLAELLFAGEEAEQDEAVAGYAAEFEQQPLVDVTNDLDRARARFVNQINQLEKGGDPTPQLEEFIPAALLALQPIVKGAIAVIGRQKVVDFLARFLAQMIRPYVGQDQAMALSQAVTSAGLRLVGFEAAPDARSTVGAEVIASTAEDTVRQVAAQPDYVLDNESLLQVAVQEAFENAAATNFPADMLKPELRETPNINALWSLMPRQGKKYYRKYVQVLDATITPQIASRITTFGGKTLAHFLYQRLRLPANRPVKAKVHLYQAIPGTWLSRISKLENVPGLGSPHKHAWSKIHPLTVQAATALLGQPGLGRDPAPRFLQRRRLIGVGQRFYYLQIESARQVVAGGRLSEVNLTLDFTRNEIRQYNYFSEVDAQNIAMELQKGGAAGAAGAWKLAKTSLEAGLRTVRSALSNGISNHVKIIHEAVYPQQFLGTAAKWLGGVVGAWLVEKLLEWLAPKLVDYFQQQAKRFIDATREPADGVTIVVTYRNVPGMPTLRDALRGGFVLPRANPFAGGMPSVDIQVLAGFHRG
jgi:hypothetical protein